MRRFLSLVVTLIAAFASGPVDAQPRIGPQSGSTGGPPPPPASNASPIALNEPMWVAVNGQSTGPFQPPEIVRKISVREIIGETMVFTNSINRWTRAADVAALQSLLQQAQAGAPAPSPPPAPPSGDNEAVARITQFVVGEWMVEQPGMYQGLTVRTQIRYFPDGNFRGARHLIGANPGGGPYTQTTPLNGRWSVQPIDDRRFVLTFTGASMAGSVQLEVLDQNRLRSEQDNYISIRVGR